jgi:large subunit ribosomal protein L10
MRKEVKINIVKELRNIIEENNGIFLLTFNNLSVAEISELRDKIKETGSRMRVVKNTLVKKAVGDDFPEFPVEVLQNTTAMAYSKDNFIDVAKILFDFHKETGKIDVKAGLVEGKKITREQAEAIAKLPPREVLLAQFAGLMVAPLRKFLMNLRAPLQNYGLLLNQLKNKKEEK